MKYYKVRDLVSGSWMEGGTNTATFSKKGKVWKNTGALRSHLTQLQHCTKQSTSPLWEIVEYDLVESERYPASSFHSPPLPRK